MKATKADAELVTRFEAANQKMHKIITQNFTLRELSKSEFFLLCLVHKNESAGIRLCTSDVSQLIRITKSAVTQIANNLQQKEYLVRIPDLHDGRKVYFSVTEKGVAVLEEQIKALHENMVSAFQSIGYDKMNQFVSIFEKLVDLIGCA